MSAVYAGRKIPRGAALVERLLWAGRTVPLRLRLAEILVEDKSYLKAFRTSWTPAAASDPETLGNQVSSRAVLFLPDYAKAVIEFDYVLHRARPTRTAAARRPARTRV